MIKFLKDSVTTVGNINTIQNYSISKSEQDLFKLIEYGYKNGYKIKVLGNGSNLLIGEVDKSFLVIHNKVKGITIDCSNVKVMSGELLPNLVRNLRDEGLSGLEWAVDIPGTVGGAVAMNAGAYGYEISDFITSVTLIDKKGKLIVKNANEIDFSYRYSSIDTDEYIIHSVVLNLVRSKYEEIQKTVASYKSRRLETQPKGRSFGSTFLPVCDVKNNKIVSAGKIIDECGLKGYRINDALLSIKHANFIINDGNATFNDIQKLICNTKKYVYELTGIELKTEVIIWNDNMKGLVYHVE